MFASTTSTVVPLVIAGGGVAGVIAFLLVRRFSTRKTASDSAPVPSTLASSNVSATVPTPAVSPEASTENVPTPDVSPEFLVDARGADGKDVSDADEEAPNVRERAGRTRSLFTQAFQSIRARGIDAATWDELEETLLLADIGIGLATRLLDPLRAAVKAGELRSPDDVINALRESMTAQLSSTDRSLHLDAAETPNVWIFVGVNGVGKTTTIGKIATAQAALGTSVLMAAGDTFRAAAAEQLQVWAERSGASFVRGAEGGDPASVIFDGIQSAASKGITLVLGDTAGRLQNKSNLMEELKKVRRVADKAPGTVNEVLLVIDATTGQNGLSQAREFAAATDVTGVVLTKLDGSAKGGIVFAIETDLGIPVKLVGLGETAADLIAFDPAEFVGALFD
ncbi:unannotated protein [freshwater metagenome]|uniref:Unannotated protein n=1 Tax=freshwater metagenome TaxID=449393 RepID=A0A6J6G0I0_9ZZZZ|nr:signal recognition particle-docking protein FtsY [Actinomycetota bacterium]